MGTYYLDTSAIVKRYVFEQGQGWVTNLCDPVYGHTLYISQIALVEVVAAICKKAREQSITITDRDNFISVFQQDCQNSYGIMPVTTDIYTAAAKLCLIHKLRAYDAVQLACALSLRDDTQKSKAPLPIFTCADNDLLSFASVEGLSTVNLNLYD